jgi:hypothetical protein
MSALASPTEERYEVRLRGFSPRELQRRAEHAAACHFGTCPFRVEEATVTPCMVSCGGRVRLYEAHLVACA